MESKLKDVIAAAEKTLNSDNPDDYKLAFEYRSEITARLAGILSLVEKNRIAINHKDSVIESLLSELKKSHNKTNPNKSNNHATNIDSESGEMLAGGSKVSEADVNIHVAIIIGHCVGAKGAYSPILGTSEYDFWNKLTQKPKFLDELKRHENLTFSIHRRLVPGYSGVRLAYEKADQAIADSVDFEGFTIELHFNSFSSNNLNYQFTMYHADSTLGKQLAATFSHEPFLTERNLGSKAATKSNCEFYNLSRSKHPSILIMPFFGSYKNLVTRYYNYSRFAKEIATRIGLVAQMRRAQLTKG